MIDTGRTMAALVEELKKYGPKTLKVARYVIFGGVALVGIIWRLSMCWILCP